MKQFIIHSTDGVILRTGTCPDEVFSLQRSGDELIMEGVADDSTQRIVDGEVVAKPALTSTEQAAVAMLEIRQLRDLLLSGSDWTQVTDSPMTAAQRSDWQTYRQSLRDLTNGFSNATTIEEVTFPTVPN
jgi:hypothetical protein|tara:strand:+ start:498 stop:887 length:390 start_codon:yes stop_codon:yes gene_type:complete